MKTLESPTNPHAAGKAAHLSVALRNLAVNSLDRDTQNHLHALANDAYELSNSHAALLAFAKTFALWDSKGIIKTLAPYEGNEGGLRELARAALQSANLEAAQ